MKCSLVMEVSIPFSVTVMPDTNLLYKFPNTKTSYKLFSRQCGFCQGALKEDGSVKDHGVIVVTTSIEAGKRFFYRSRPPLRLDPG
jgi:hypothetical protein